MADYGGATPSMGIPYKGSDSPATVAADNQAAYKVIDAKLSDLEARQAAREKLIITHTGEGLYTVTNGLGEPVAVNNDGDDNYSFVV